MFDSTISNTLHVSSFLVFVEWFLYEVPTHRHTHPSYHSIAPDTWWLILFSILREIKTTSSNAIPQSNMIIIVQFNEIIDSAEIAKKRETTRDGGEREER